MSGKWVVTLVATVLMMSSADVLAESAPCSSAQYREFDFWLGEWVVETETGKQAGRNRIESVHGGCLLVESWSGSRGSTGTSMSYFSGHDRQWHQLWVSPGVIIDISGGLADDGSMRLVGTIYYQAEDALFPFRGSWSQQPDGSVVQFFEEARAADDWKPWFRGIYRSVVAS